MRQPEVEFAIVGEQQQACGILVQSSHRIHPLGDVNQVDDNSPASVAATRDISFGLVEHDIDHGLVWLNQLSGHFHLIGLGVDFNAQLSHDLSVYFDLTVLNMVLGFSPGADARIRNIFLESDHYKTSFYHSEKFNFYITKLRVFYNRLSAVTFLSQRLFFFVT
jgi:hypothetical protein